MCYTLGTLHSYGAVGHDNVFCWDENRCLALEIGVVIHLLKCGTGGWQVPQHPLVLHTKLRHALCQLVVHVILDPLGSFFFLSRVLTNDLGLHRPLGRECLHDGFTLEPHHGFCNHGVEHTTSAIPRFCALFVLQAKQHKPFFVSLLPVFSGVQVVFDVLKQLVPKAL